MTEPLDMPARLRRWAAALGDPMAPGRANPDNDLIYLLRDAAERIDALEAAHARLEDERDGALATLAGNDVGSLPHDWTDPRLPDFRLIWAVGRQAGYAIGLHGSMKRDCDLIAVPWVDDPQPAQALIETLCAALDARQVGEAEAKPLGRRAVTLQVDGYVKPIDLSVFGPNDLAPGATALIGAGRAVSSDQEQIAVAAAAQAIFNGMDGYFPPGVGPEVFISEARAAIAAYQAALDRADSAADRDPLLDLRDAIVHLSRRLEAIGIKIAAVRVASQRDWERVVAIATLGGEQWDPKRSPEIRISGVLIEPVNGFSLVDLPPLQNGTMFFNTEICSECGDVRTRPIAFNLIAKKDDSEP